MERKRNRHRLTRTGLLGALALAGSLLLVRSQALWAQNTGQPSFFLALATGAQETPPVDTPAVALARFTLTPDNKLAYEIHMTGLTADFTAMHLHRGRTGQAGPIVYPLTVPFTNNVSMGSVDFKPEDAADLSNQGFYFNIHTTAHPDGEIRGQVAPVPQEFVAPLAAGADVSFAKEIQPIFTASCALPGCHAGNSPQQGQNLSAGQAFANTVGVKSVEAPSLNRIQPGDPQKSYLWHKINGTQQTVGGSGARMPFGRAALPADQIAKIQQWIQQGAKNN
jgi:CHRD domain